MGLGVDSARASSDGSAQMCASAYLCVRACVRTCAKNQSVRSTRRAVDSYDSRDVNGIVVVEAREMPDHVYAMPACDTRERYK